MTKILIIMGINMREAHTKIHQIMRKTHIKMREAHFKTL